MPFTLGDRRKVSVAVDALGAAGERAPTAESVDSCHCQRLPSTHHFWLGYVAAGTCVRAAKPHFVLVVGQQFTAMTQLLSSAGSHADRGPLDLTVQGPQALSWKRSGKSFSGPTATSAARTQAPRRRQGTASPGRRNRRPQGTGPAGGASTGLAQATSQTSARRTCLTHGAKRAILLPTQPLQATSPDASSLALSLRTLDGTGSQASVTTAAGNNQAVAREAGAMSGSEQGRALLGMKMPLTALGEIGRPPSQLSMVSKPTEQEAVQTLESLYALLLAELQRPGLTGTGAATGMAGHNMKLPPPRSYLDVAMAQADAVAGMRVNAMICRRVDAMIAAREAMIKVHLVAAVDQQIQQALERGDGDSLWRIIELRVEMCLDRYLTQQLEDAMSLVTRMVRDQIKEQLTMRRLTSIAEMYLAKQLMDRRLMIVAERHLELSLGPQSAVLQQTAAKQEVLTFSNAIEEITTMHVQNMLRPLITERMTMVIPPLMEVQTRERLSAWAPDNNVLAAAVDTAAATRIDDQIGHAVERVMLGTQQLTSPLRHVLSGMIRTQLPHLCPKSNVEHLVIAQFEKTDRYKA